MAWFHNPESGQTFEAEGYWEHEARMRGYEEVDGPEGGPVAKPDPGAGRVKEDESGPTDEGQAVDGSDDSKVPASDEETKKSDVPPLEEKGPDNKAKGGKEKK